MSISLSCTLIKLFSWNIWIIFFFGSLRKERGVWYIVKRFLATLSKLKHLLVFNEGVPILWSLFLVMMLPDPLTSPILLICWNILAPGPRGVSWRSVLGVSTHRQRTLGRRRNTLASAGSPQPVWWENSIAREQRTRVLKLDHVQRLLYIFYLCGLGKLLLTPWTSPVKCR